MVKRKQTGGDGDWVMKYNIALKCNFIDNLLQIIQSQTGGDGLQNFSATEMELYSKIQNKIENFPLLFCDDGESDDELSREMEEYINHFKEYIKNQSIILKPVLKAKYSVWIFFIEHYN